MNISRSRILNVPLRSAQAAQFLANSVHHHHHPHHHQNTRDHFHTPTSKMSTSTTTSTYKGATPPTNNGTPVSPQIISFYESFYATSDSPSESSHKAYVNAFTPDATLIMGTRKATGSDELMTLRKGLWTGPVKTRKHTLNKIFPWDRDGNEVMLFGSVLYGLNNGKEVTVDWAGRAELVKDQDGDGEVRMKFYQVYLDSAPVANAMKD